MLFPFLATKTTIYCNDWHGHVTTVVSLVPRAIRIQNSGWRLVRPGDEFYLLRDMYNVPIRQLSAMSWFIPVLVGLFAIYLVRRLMPRSKVDIKGKYVLITGCDSGFGRLTAIRLDKMGVCVLATCLTKEGEQSLKSVASDKLKTFQMDVTNSQQIKEIYEEVERRIPSDSGILKSCKVILILWCVTYPSSLCHVIAVITQMSCKLYTVLTIFILILSWK